MTKLKNLKPKDQWEPCKFCGSKNLACPIMEPVMIVCSDCDASAYEEQWNKKDQQITALKELLREAVKMIQDRSFIKGIEFEENHAIRRREKLIAKIKETTGE